MSSIEDRLRAVQTRISAKTAERARAEVELEHAQKAELRAKEALSELGATTNAELQELYARLEKELEDAVAEAEAALAESEASPA